MRNRDLGREKVSRILGRKLNSNEIVHHKDGNHYNNDIENLVLKNRADHIRIHKPVLGYKFTEDQKKRLSNSHLGQIAWNKGTKGFKHSEKSRLNMSCAQRGRKITWGDKISKSKTKVKLEDILEVLRENPNIKLNELKDKLNIKTHGPIQKFGGLKKIKKKIYESNIP